MPGNNGSKGRAGESRAAQFLEAAGMSVVTRNLRLPGGEVDIVCREGETIVFIEVKARSGRRFGSAVSAVDARKRRTLRRLAADWVQIVAPNARVRFDVVAVEGDRMTLYRNAF
ncbi:MAG TPA: YraN family protein [Candidatus Baltobacteraceae bacterium]|nr:YraN family protein [Candidatus Baltobacteraceae bacterium]